MPARSLPPGLGAFDAQRQLEVLFVANQNVGAGGDFREDVAQLFLAALPEGSAVVEVEADLGAVVVRVLAQLKAELAGLGRQRRKQAGNVHHAHAVGDENALEIKVLGLQRAADFTGAVVVHARAAHAEAGVCNVELVTIAPRAALLNFGSFVADVATAKLTLDKGSDRAAGDKRGQHPGSEAQRRGDVEHIALGAGGLHRVMVSDSDGLTIRGRNANAHAGCRNEIILFHFCASSKPYCCTVIIP